MGVDHEEYLLGQDQSVYMAFIDWIAWLLRAGMMRHSIMVSSPAGRGFWHLAV